MIGLGKCRPHSLLQALGSVCRALFNGLNLPLHNITDTADLSRRLSVQQQRLLEAQGGSPAVEGVPVKMRSCNSIIGPMVLRSIILLAIYHQ